MNDSSSPKPRLIKSDPDPFRRFQNTMRALLAVPKKELDEQAAKWKRRKNKKASPGHIVT